MKIYRIFCSFAKQFFIKSTAFRLSCEYAKGRPVNMLSSFFSILTGQVKHTDEAVLAYQRGGFSIPTGHQPKPQVVKNELLTAVDFSINSIMNSNINSMQACYKDIYITKRIFANFLTFFSACLLFLKNIFLGKGA